MATNPSHEYDTVALPQIDPAGLKGEDSHRMNREDGQQKLLLIASPFSLKIVLLTYTGCQSVWMVR